MRLSCLQAQQNAVNIPVFMQSYIQLLIEQIVMYPMGCQQCVSPVISCSCIAPLVFLLLSYNFSAFYPVQRPETLQLVVNTQKIVAVKNE